MSVNDKQVGTLLNRYYKTDNGFKDHGRAKGYREAVLEAAVRIAREDACVQSA